jgi:hypothetical protein
MMIRMFRLLHRSLWLMLLLAPPFAKASERIEAAMRQQPPAIDIRSGHEIPSEGYCDQPYVVKLPDGTWLCTMTTGKGHEGQGGQHVVSTRSPDRGKSWEPHVDIESADGPEASSSSRPASRGSCVARTSRPSAIRPGSNGSCCPRASTG